MNTQSMTIPGFTNRIAYAKDLVRNIDALDPDSYQLDSQARIPLLRDFAYSVANGVLQGDDARYVASLIVSELF